MHVHPIRCQLLVDKSVIKFIVQQNNLLLGKIQEMNMVLLNDIIYVAGVYKILNWLFCIFSWAVSRLWDKYAAKDLPIYDDEKD